LALVASTAIIVPSHAQEKRGPATEQERERVMALATLAEKDPMAFMSSTDARWFQKWTEEVPDYSFGPDKGAFWFFQQTNKSELGRLIRFYHDLYSASFQVKNQILDAEKNPNDLEAKTLAGVEGLLRMYEAVLTKRPEMRNAEIDRVIDLRNKAELAAFVKQLPPMPKRP
jgi:hypothetical protein